MVYDPSWNASTFRPHDAAVADDLNPANIRTWPCTLSSFENRGGKLIAYHGLQDEKITSFNTQRFYEHLLQGMQASPQDLDAFFRFFRIPGMSHCQTGPGAWVFGQGGGAANEGIAFDPSYNVLAAMVRWVEDGVAPGDIVGTKFVDDNVGNGVEFRKRHCRYVELENISGGVRGQGADGSVGIHREARIEEGTARTWEVGSVCNCGDLVTTGFSYTAQYGEARF